jgi:hypothetical protein
MNTTRRASSPSVHALWISASGTGSDVGEVRDNSKQLKFKPRIDRVFRTDGHRGRWEISSYSSLRQSNARSLRATRAFTIAITPSPWLLSSGSARQRRGGRLAIRWIQVDAAATQPTPNGFLVNVAS